MRQAVFSTLLLVVAGIVLFPSPATTAAIDDARAAAAGIRKLPGKRLTLYTDLTGPEIDELPAVFDQAFPQWCQYFKVKEADQPDWHMTGFLMNDKARFVAAGLLPDHLPTFNHGYSQGRDLWLYQQPSDYYRRHLLLHEGTHGFMNAMFGKCGPPWYMEGIAEYLATHRWQRGRASPFAPRKNATFAERKATLVSSPALTLGYMPQSRDEVPLWGRIRIIQDAAAQHRALGLKAVLDFPQTPHRNDTEPYAWCWAAATLLDRHPRYRDRFRQLVQFVDKEDFNEQFFRLFEADWQELCEEWQLMVANLEYGYDVERSAVDFTPGTIAPRPLGEGQREVSPRPLGEGSGVRAASPADSVTIAADRGWQNSGLRLEAGVKYRLTATGRYQVAKEPKPWWCEPGGVSIRYYRGRPLGVLLAAVRPDHPAPGSDSALLHPTVVGLGTTLLPTETGTLFLKINDSAGELADNAGQLNVEVGRE